MAKTFSVAGAVVTVVRALEITASNSSPLSGAVAVTL